MPNDSMIPRPPSLRDIRRDQEDEARRREQQTNSRKSDNTTVSSGGKFDVDGNFTVRNGGNGTIERGGKMNVRGSMDITDEGEVNVIGNGRGYSSDKLIKVIATLANRLAYNAWIGFSYLVPGLYFTAEGESQGPYDPRVVSSDGKGVDAYSAVEDLPYGPQVGPNIKSRGSFGAGTWSAGVGVTAWDDSINPGGGDGVAGIRGSGSINVTPWDLSILLTNHTDGPDGIPGGAAIWMRGDLEEGMLRIYARNGVDIEGSFTVNGQPVGGAVTSVAGKTGAVLLAKGDVGLGSVDNTTDLAKPVSTATQTALNGKAPATHTHAAATTSAAGFMSAADKVALDAANQIYHATYTAVNSTAPLAASNPGTLNLVTAESQNADAICTVTGAGKVRIEVAGFYSMDWFAFHGGVEAGADSYMNVLSSHRPTFITSIDIPPGSGSSAVSIGSIYFPAGAVISFICSFRIAQPNLRSFITFHKL